MDKQLHVVLTRTREKKPLATVRNLPGEDADLTPAQMRALAAALVAAADACEANPVDGRHWAPKRVSFEMKPDRESTPG